MSDLLENFELSLSRCSVSLISVIVKIALLGLGIKSFAGVVKLLGVLLKSSLLVSQSLFDFLEFEIKDYDSGESIFHVTKDPDLGLPTLTEHEVWKHSILVLFLVYPRTCETIVNGFRYVFALWCARLPLRRSVFQRARAHACGLSVWV